MISGIVTDKDGNPVAGNGKKLTESKYNPVKAVKDLFAQVQTDFIVAYNLQMQPFPEFDDMSLLQRDKLDTETFGAYVGAFQEPIHKQWRWKGRKNTARNKIIGILAHIIAGMLFPMAYAYNEENEEAKVEARVMKILIENHLRKAKYELKFLYFVLSALVHPAVFVEVEYVEAIQRIKTKMPDGSYKVEEAVDELLSGIGMNIVPLDQILLGDFYTSDIQRQPYIIRVRRISYDDARKIYAGKYFVDGVDQFEYVTAGTTRIVQAGTDGQTLYDYDYSEADGNFVQIITALYRGEDLEVTFVGGVFMGNEKDIYNSNPFSHRRMSMIGNEYKSIPVYGFAKTGFEPIDPSGKFAYYKSAAFKEFWDDASQNKMYQLAQDGTFLDVIKPLFLSGVSNVDGTVMVPGATIGMPIGATATPYQLGPNLAAAMQMMNTNKEDMSDSTQDPIQSGVTQKGVTAYAVSKAEQNAQIFLGVFGVMIADLVRQVGELYSDDIILHTTVGELDATVPESLKMRYKKVRVQGKDGGKDVTNIIEFSTDMMGLSPEKANEMEWEMFDRAGGMSATSNIFKVNPYKFARTQFSIYIDADKIISRSMGTDALRKERAFNLLTDPRVAPYVDQQAVVNKYVLEEFADGDPDAFKKSPEQVQQDLMQSALGGVVQPPSLSTNA